MQATNREKAKNFPQIEKPLESPQFMFADVNSCKPPACANGQVSPAVLPCCYTQDFALNREAVSGFATPAAAPRLKNPSCVNYLGLAPQAILCRRFAAEKMRITMSRLANRTGIQPVWVVSRSLGDQRPAIAVSLRSRRSIQVFKLAPPSIPTQRDEQSAEGKR